MLDEGEPALCRGSTGVVYSSKAVYSEVDKSINPVGALRFDYLLQD